MSEKGIGKQIEESILVELKKGALQRSSIIERAMAAMPGVNRHTIEGNISRMNAENIITQLERGIWALPGFVEPNEKDTLKTKVAKRPGEYAFYKSFAEWLLAYGNCTDAIPLGGSALGDKWMTPDVVGIDEVPNNSMYRGSEITAFVSAEIKVSTTDNEIIRGFGQACSYLYFSHKSILVIPKDASDKVKVRMESLCRLIGLGLVLFDASNAVDPDFRISLQPIHREPDVVALNYVLEQEEIYKRLISVRKM